MRSTSEHYAATTDGLVSVIVEDESSRASGG